MSTRITAIAFAASALAACSADDTASSSQQVVEIRGDTTVVRTLSGSVWGAEATLVPEVAIGELDGPDEYLFGRIGSFAVDDDRRVFVLDRQAQHVRAFDSNGTYLKTLGGRGEGPGELSVATSVALLPDGRVLVHEAAAMRIQVYGPGPRDTDQWEYTPAAVLVPPKPLEVDRRGRTFVVALELRPSGQFVESVIVINPDGDQRDMLLPPGSDFEPPSLELQLGNTSMLVPVPMTPQHHWALHPNGHFLTGISSDYRVDLGLDQGVLRIERAFAPVAISDAERNYHREDMERGMRASQSGWRWNGPPVPRTRPAFRSLATGRDGRIWVTLPTEAYPVENERYDVFEPDGTYLGAVVPPEGFAGTPRPVFDGDHVWALTRDEVGVERVVRYRINPDV